jgi:hypothetical protein
MAEESERDEGGSDLFDRWLSHRQESTGEAPRPRTYGVPRTGLAGADPADPGAAAAEEGTPPAAADGTEHPEAETAADALGVAAPDAAAAESPEDGAASKDDEPQVPADPAPSPAAAPQPPTHREPVGLDEFEPVVIASVRRQAEAPVEKRSRLARFRRAGLEPDPAGEEPADDRPADEVAVGIGVADEVADYAPGAVEHGAADELADDASGAVEHGAVEHGAVEHGAAEHGAVEHGAAEHGAIDDGATPHEVMTRATVGPAPPAPERGAPSTEPHQGYDEPPWPAERPTPYVAPAPSVPPHPAEVPVAGPSDGGDEPAAAAASGPDPDPRTAAPPSPSAPPSPPAPPPRPSAAPRGEQDAAAAVFAAFNPGAFNPGAANPGAANPGAAPAPAPPEARGTTTPATPTATPPAAAPPVAQTTPESPRRALRRPRPSLGSYVEAARTTLDRSVRGTPEERVASGTAAAAPAPTEQPVAPETAAPEGPATEAAPARSAYDELRAQREAAAPPQPDVLPPSIDFRPRTLARRVTSVLLLVGLVATGIAAWRAYDSRDETDIGLAAILALATGVVWAIRAGSVPTRVGLHGGVLEVRSQAGRFVFEVTGAHTRLEVVGSPGRRGSRLLVHRRGLAPFEITVAMVDLRRLVEALRYYRPDL